MTLRLRKRSKRFPGLWLNVSKSRSGASVGVPGRTGHGKTRTTASLPGSGLSYVSMGKSGPPASLPRPKAHPLDGGRHGGRFIQSGCNPHET